MGERDDWPLGLHALKSKAGISLTNASKISLYRLPPNSSNLAEILYRGCFIFSYLSVYFGKLLGRLWEEIGCFIEEIGYLEKSVAD